MTEPTTRVLSIPEPSSARFDLRCWGEFRLFDRLQSEERSPQGRKARAIIAYLAAHGGASISRERLAALLWSERGDQQARASLRQTLVELRPYATDPSRLLVIERDQVHLDGLALTSDIGRIEALARADDLDALSQALREKGDRLYDGLDALDPAFDEWLARERRIQQDRLLSLGAAAAARGLKRGVDETVSRLATELQTLDETNEAVAQIGMQADHARGDGSAVGRRYRRLCEALNQDLGVTPSRVTETLLRELTGPEWSSGVGREPAPVTQAAPSLPHSTRPSLAVLPFINRSGLEADDIFADGIVEDLAAALSARPLMKIVAASATAIHRNAARDLRQIGRDLGARYLLEGNLRRVGDDLRVTTQLVEAESGTILWSQNFNRPLAKVSALQEDLVTELAANLGVQVQRVEIERALKRRGDITAWEAARRADSHAYRATRSGWEAAVAENKRALEIDSHDGALYARLAAAQGALLNHRGGGDPQLAQEIVDNIRRARALDPDNPVVLWCVAAALRILGKLQEALALAGRAVAIQPDAAFAHHALGSVLVRFGRSDEALGELDVAERLAPNAPWLCHLWNNRAAAHLWAGRFDQALQAADQAARLRPGPEPLILRMLCLAKLDRWEPARDALRRLRDADPEISCAFVEHFVRNYVGETNAGDEYVATARKIWDETPSEPKSA